MLKLRDFCVGISDFDWLKVISVGRFAEVTVVKEKSTNNVYVAKRLRKSDVLNSNEVSELVMRKRRFDWIVNFFICYRRFTLKMRRTFYWRLPNIAKPVNGFHDCSILFII